MNIRENRLATPLLMATVCVLLGATLGGCAQRSTQTALKEPANTNPGHQIRVSRDLASDTRGTLGCYVQDRQGAVYGLTNRHVLRGGRWVTWFLTWSTPCCRSVWIDPPPPYAPADSMYLGGGSLGTGWTYSSRFDAACFLVPKPQAASVNLIVPHPGAAGKFAEPIRPEAGMPVFKIGETTGFTEGIVLSVDAAAGEFIIKPKTVTPGVGSRFIGKEDDPACAFISKGGDSGAIWATVRDGKLHPVGLHCYGAIDCGPLSAAVKSTEYVVGAKAFILADVLDDLGVVIHP